MATDTITALEVLLDDERLALMSGKLQKLPDILVRKEKLSLAIGAQTSADPLALSRLRHKAQENDRLLQAARLGLKAARQRLEEIIRNGEGLRTYSSHGQIENHKSAQSHRLTRRA